MNNNVDYDNLMLNTLSNSNNMNNSNNCVMKNNFTNELNSGGAFQDNNYNLDDMYAQY